MDFAWRNTDLIPNYTRTMRRSPIALGPAWESFRKMADDRTVKCRDASRDRMIGFLIERKTGVISFNSLKNIPEFERKSLVTEEGAAEHNLEWDRLSSLDRRTLRESYMKAKRELKSEEEYYQTQLSPTSRREFEGFPFWSAQEALALSFNVHPRENFVFWAQKNTHVSCWARDVCLRFERLNRALRVGDLTDPVKPNDFAAWLNRTVSEVPADGRFDAQQIQTSQIAIDQSVSDAVAVESCDSDEVEFLRNENKTLKETIYKLNSPEYSVLKQMFGAICREQYGWDPAKKRNAATRQIMQIFEKRTNLLAGKNHASDMKKVLRYIQDAIDALPEKHRTTIDDQGTELPK